LDEQTTPEQIPNCLAAPQKQRRFLYLLNTANHSDEKRKTKIADVLIFLIKEQWCTGFTSQFKYSSQCCAFCAVDVSPKVG